MKKSYFSGFFYMNESPNQIVLKRKWRNFFWSLLFLVLSVFASFLLIASESSLWFILPVLLLSYISVCAVFNVITITINPEYIKIHRGFFPLWGNETILAKDFDYISIVDEYSGTGKRLYSQSKGFHDEKTRSGYDFVVYLKEKRRTSLLGFSTSDYESAEFLKSKIHKYFNIK